MRCSSTSERRRNERQVAIRGLFTAAATTSRQQAGSQLSSSWYFAVQASGGMRASLVHEILAP